MKCVVCKGPDIVTKLVDEEIKVDNDIVLTPMEVLVCSKSRRGSTRPL